MTIRALLLALSVICATGTVALADPAAHRIGNGDVVTLPTRPSVSEDVLLLPPRDGRLAGWLILFTGGDGDLDLAGREADWIGTNFLVRSRELFAVEGFGVAVIDAPSDHPEGYGGSFRASAEHAADIAALIAELRRRALIPVWLVGTSRGTISAANGALLRSGGADGLVLTSTVTRSSKRRAQAVTDLALGDIQLPVLLVHNRDDACAVTPYAGVAELERRLNHAAKVAVLTFGGGDPPQSEPCEALSRHGYYGIEHLVVSAIATWIKSNSPLTSPASGG